MHWFRKSRRRSVDRLRSRLEELEQSAGAFPPGHYYSPIVADADIPENDAPPEIPASLPGIDLNAAGQAELLRDFAAFQGELPFRDRPTDGLRYHLANDWFAHGDAIALYSMLRHLRPRRIVEVGSGFSSALMLDVADRFLTPPPAMTFVEPYPERLEELLGAADHERCEIRREPLQAQPLELFTTLADGDLLFIDSSHVSKYGSDVNRIFFDILPRIAPGVVVHFHDVFYPFEYPVGWLRRGIFWNEDYLLRAFLTENRAWEVLFFNSYLALLHHDTVAATLPRFLENPGGSIYLRKR